MNDIIEEVCGDLTEPLHGIGAVLKVDPLSSVQGDPILLKQVFQNLITNAIKYRRPEVPLQIDVSGKQMSMTHYRIMVTDNGSGFEAAFNERIFEPFRRLVSGDAIEGAGIGLSTVKKIIEIHDGTITAAGILGTGATFIIELPLYQNAKKADTTL